MFVHRIVAEQKLGRLLADAEIVHHRNGNKYDYSPDNLDVLTQSIHASLHRPEPTVLTLDCARCGRQFTRRKGNEPHKKGYKRAFCSRKCYGNGSDIKPLWDGRELSSFVPRCQPEEGGADKQCSEAPVVPSQYPRFLNPESGNSGRGWGKGKVAVQGKACSTALPAHVDIAAGD